jgi:hypothetical protein
MYTCLMSATSQYGNKQRAYYVAAKALIDGGMTAKAAFEQVAADNGVGAGTVQTGYYREARKDPDAIVMSRTRGTAKLVQAKAHQDAPPDLEPILDALSQAVEDLKAWGRSMEQRVEQAESEAQAKAMEKLRAALAG